MPHEPSSSSRIGAGDLQVRNWLLLRRELRELHARLEYLKLMRKLGVAH